MPNVGLIDLGKVGSARNNRDKLKQGVQIIFDSFVIFHIEILAGVLTVAYILSVTLAPTFSSLSSGRITAGLLEFNTIVLSLLIAFATIYLPVLEGRRIEATRKVSK